ncbi:hypothetical protein BOO86_22130 [Mycobacterium sp. CBMA 234]|uniref:alpha/beta hydrolase n=1 Tax=Mycolicibacterium sp. CBMA 234 TaxID=1918495 RepID=UPI0012DD9A28|nr:alpha/beta hydrolase [Mycolicibacterium sp. CBMA 234]MUL67189.1 hypothetical protein [Mycolicibacterium sp. CBMA 234]
MTANLRGMTAVLLPGTGSDDDYIRRAFGGALVEAGAVVIAPPPMPGGLIAGYLAALDDAAQHGAIIVGGVSLGAAVAVNWALKHPDECMAVLAALPAWTGDADGAPAAIAARYSAQQLREIGLDAAIAGMRAGSPAWLADELTRSWTAQWPALPDAMEEAAGYGGPTREQLAQLRAPMGVAGAVDDAVHPVAVAAEWAVAAPRAALRTVTLEAMGEQPTVLGDACVAALRETVSLL